MNRSTAKSVCAGMMLLLSFAILRTAAADVPFRHSIIDGDPPESPWMKIAEDIDGDGYADVVVGGREGPLVWYRYPDWRKSVISKGGYSTVDGEAADMDGDGDPDIVMGGIVWYQNPRPSADPGQAAWKAHRVAEHPTHDVEIGDLDGDGDFDIVTRDQSEFGHKAGNEIHVWRRNGGDSWAERVIGCPHGEGIALADVDRDGDVDIVIGGRWYENTGDIIGGQWTEHLFASFHSNATVLTADINRDGRPDIILTPSELKGEYYRMSWFEGPADPAKGEWIEHVVEDSVECVLHSLAVADIDGDGRIDIVTAEMHQGEDPDEVNIYFNSENGKSWVKQTLSLRGSHYIRTADIGADGDIDIIGANHAGDYQPVELWENRRNDTE